MIVDKEKYINHIIDQDKILDMRKILDKIEIVLNSHSPQTTDFLDPYERLLAKSILNRFPDLSYREKAGLDGGERQIIEIYPSYYSPYDLEESLGAIRFVTKEEGLSHRDFLGAILNLGIIRGKIGDILIHKDFTDVVVKKEIEDFILFNIERIKKYKLRPERIDLENLFPVEIDFKEIGVNLSSYRLDVYISGLYKLSRQESQSLIKREFVKVNWQPTSKASKELELGDLVSIRGYGRSVLHSIQGISRKEKIKAIIRIIL